MMKAKISPNQSGWPRAAAIRRKGKQAAKLSPIRKNPCGFFTSSICPTLTTTPPRASSRAGRTLASWLRTKLSPVCSDKKKGNSVNRQMKLV